MLMEGCHFLYKVHIAPISRNFKSHILSHNISTETIYPLAVISADYSHAGVGLKIISLVLRNILKQKRYWENTLFGFY